MVIYCLVFQLFFIYW